MDRKFLFTSFGYAILGLCLGIYMAASKDKAQMVTHAHILLVGFVISFVYAVCHRLWLNTLTSRLAKAQYYIHQAGTLGLAGGLFLYFGQFVDLQTIDPLLALSSVAVLVGMVLMKILFIVSTRDTE